MLLSILRFGVSLLLPVIVFSCIPSFYPIYKVLIAPHLPELVQQFFSDLKGLFLSFCSLFLSGAVSTSSITHNNLSTVFSSQSAENPFQLSLQDWVLLYIQRCDVLHGVTYLKGVCRSCCCPSWIEEWRTGRNAEMCDVCDLCNEGVNGANHLIGSLSMDEHCLDIINDMLHIVDSGKTTIEPSSPIRTVLRDCASTFLLYMRFSFHAISRFVARSSHNFWIFIRYCFFFIEWIVYEIRTNFATNPILSVAMLFVLLFFFLALVSLLRNLVLALRLVFGLYSSCLHISHQNTKIAPKRGAVRSASPRDDVNAKKHASRQAVKEPVPMPSWLQRGVKPEPYETQWGVICRDMPSVAELIVLCQKWDEELNCLYRLLEQLHAGGGELAA